MQRSGADWKGNEPNRGDRIDWWVTGANRDHGAGVGKIPRPPCVSPWYVALDFEPMDAGNFNGSVDDVQVFALPIKRRRFYRVVNFSSRVARRRKSFLPTARNCHVNWSRCSEDSCENFIIYRFYACHFSYRTSCHHDDCIEIEHRDVSCQVELWIIYDPVEWITRTASVRIDTLVTR